MAPRGGFSNPPPKTASAVAARQAFFCDLCQKGYSRQNEFAAHEASYDHAHRQRLKELKEMNKSMDTSAAKARKQEDKASGIMRIELGGPKKEGGGAGFKKAGSGFKSAFGAVDGGAGELEKDMRKADGAEEVVSAVQVEDVETDSEDEEYDLYDPRKPTGCPLGCTERG